MHETKKIKLFYFQSVLGSFIHPSVQVRHAALKVIQLILGQGLVHPVQVGLGNQYPR